MFCCFRNKKLKKCTKDNTQWLSFNGKTLECKIVDIYDADTVTLVLLLNKQYYKVKCRLTGIDAAEIRTKNKMEKKVGIEGIDYLRGLILNKIVKVICGKNDKYGRLLGTIYYKNLNINEHIINKGYAYEYKGKTKKKFEEWYFGSSKK